MRRSLVALVAVIAAGCASGGSPADPPAQTADLTGTVTYRPRIALPPDAHVRVELLDVSVADAPATVLGEQTFASEGRQVPLPFRLTYDPQALRPDRTYAVHAEIRDGADRLIWTTARQHSFTPGQTGPVEVVVGPVASEEPVDEVTLMVPTGVRWRLVAFERGGEAVMLPPGEGLSLTFGDDGRISGEAGCNRFGGPYGAGADGLIVGRPISTLVACPEPSAGQAYLGALGGATVERVTADTLRLRLPSGGHLAYAAGTDAWDDARARGASFRAVGQEPGWALEIVPGERIEFTTGYGERRVVTPDPGVREEAGRQVYHAQTESADLRVVIEPLLCADVMSGAPYPATVEVTLDGETVRGCGRSL